MKISKIIKINLCILRQGRFPIILILKIIKIIKIIKIGLIFIILIILNIFAIK